VNPSAETAPAPGSGSERAFFGHPAGLLTIFLLEMWERMSFYGMRALLILFLVEPAAHGGLALDVRTAASIYGLYVGGTYIACLPGGWIGDRVLGAKRTVLAGGVIITLGHILLGLAATPKLFFLGLLVIVLGTGMLKTNAGALVAALYPEGGARRDAGFTIYYIGVNVGGMLGPLIAGALAVRYGWPAGFFAAAVGMAAGVVLFLIGRRRLPNTGAKPDAPVSRGSVAILVAGLAVLFVAVASMLTGAVAPDPTRLAQLATEAVVGVALLFFVYLLAGAGLTAIQRQRVVVVIVLFVASTLFWAGFEQGGSSLNLFAERFTERHLGGHEVPAEWLQSLDSIFIILFGPVFSSLWLMLGRRHLDPPAGAKFALGVGFMAAAFAVMASASHLIAGGAARVGMGWLIATYLLCTWGELSLSPVGMSAVSKLVPERFTGQSIGIFFVSLSLGNLLAGRIAGGIDPNRVGAMPGQFMFIVWFCGICAAALLVLLPLLRRWSHGAD
jgi:POT family proton-dependent oligopeptide transporter